MKLAELVALGITVIILVVFIISQHGHVIK